MNLAGKKRRFGVAFTRESEEKIDRRARARILGCLTIAINTCAPSPRDKIEHAGSVEQQGRIFARLHWLLRGLGKYLAFSLSRVRIRRSEFFAALHGDAAARRHSTALYGTRHRTHHPTRTSPLFQSHLSPFER